MPGSGARRTKTTALIDQIDTDAHSPAIIRVNAILSTLMPSMRHTTYPRETACISLLKTVYPDGIKEVIR